MKAVVITQYGRPADVLALREVAQPVPADHQVLVQVHAASLNVSDLAPIGGGIIARLLGSGWRKPRRDILGADLAGRVVAVGKDVTRFQPGDEVFGVAPGSVAEMVCAAEDRLVHKPAHITFAEAAAVPVAGISALQGLRQGGIGPGQQVLVQGASGGVGTFAVQIARALGAEVTAVCSPRNVESARQLGASRVIDYTRTDFTQQGQTYDLILAVNGTYSPLAYRKVLRPQGQCVIVGGSIKPVVQAMLLRRWLSREGGQRIGFMGIARITRADLDFLAELLAAGKIRPLIETSYPMGESVAAVAHVATGHARAKVVVTIIPDN